MQVSVVADRECNALQDNSTRFFLNLADSGLPQISETVGRPSMVRYRPSSRSSDAMYCLAARNSIATGSGEGTSARDATAE